MKSRAKVISQRHIKSIPHYSKFTYPEKQKGELRWDNSNGSYIRAIHGDKLNLTNP